MGAGEARVAGDPSAGARIIIRTPPRIKERRAADMEPPEKAEPTETVRVYKPSISLHGLICGDMEMNPPNFGNVSTGELERASDQFDEVQLQGILRKYIGTEDMYSAQYLYGVNENIKLLEDIGRAVETPETAEALVESMRTKEPLFVRCLVVVFKAWQHKYALAQAQAEPDAAAELLEALMRKQAELNALVEETVE